MLLFGQFHSRMRRKSSAFRVATSETVLRVCSPHEYLPSLAAQSGNARPAFRCASRALHPARYTPRLKRILRVAALLAREGHAFGVRRHEKMAAIAAFPAHHIDPRLELFDRYSLAQHRLLNQALGLRAKFLLVGHVVPISIGVTAIIA